MLLRRWRNEAAHRRACLSCLTLEPQKFPIGECMAAINSPPILKWASKPWGTRHFGVLDEDGNPVTFAERSDGA